MDVLQQIGHLRRLAYAGRSARNWYPVVGDCLRSYASRQGIPATKVIDYFAILSPRVQLKRNVTLLRQYLESGSIDGVMAGTRSALQHYEATREIRGLKTSSFARALRGDGRAVTCDVWIARALGVDPCCFAKPASYALAVRLITSTSVFAGLSPRDCQACIWLGVQNRRLDYSFLKGLHDDN